MLPHIIPHMKTKKLTRTSQFSVTAYNLLAYGMTYCTECGGEVVSDWGKCHYCLNPSTTLETSTGELIPSGNPMVKHLNKTAEKMVVGRIDWTGIDLEEWYSEFGSFSGIADALGVSVRSVKRRYDATKHVEDDDDTPINSFY